MKWSSLIAKTIIKIRYFFWGFILKIAFGGAKKSVFQILNSKTLICKTMVYINGHDYWFEISIFSNIFPNVPCGIRY